MSIILIILLLLFPIPSNPTPYEQSIISDTLNNTPSPIVNITTIHVVDTLPCDQGKIGCTIFYQLPTYHTEVYLLHSKDYYQYGETFKSVLYHELGHIDGVLRYDNSYMLNESYADSYIPRGE